MLRSLLTKFQYRAGILNFPLNFGGLPVDDAMLKSRYVPMHLRCRQTMSRIFEEELSEGFKFAFLNFLAALEEKDLTFLKTVCEPTLLQELERSISTLAGHDLHVKVDNVDEADLKLKYTSFSFIFGPDHNREANLQKELCSSFSVFNPKSGLDIKWYKPKAETKPSSPFMSICCLFSFPNGVYLKNNGGQIIDGQSSTNYHKVIFEGIPEFDASTEIVEKGQKDMWKLLTNNETEEKIQLIREVFQTEKMRWQVADIDDYMFGNPYSKDYQSSFENL